MLETILMTALWTALAVLVTFGAIALALRLLIRQKKYKLK